MFKYVVILSLVLIGSVNLNGQTGTLEGTVVDSINGEPARYAYVLVHVDGAADDSHVRTGPDGKFKIALEPGFYDVFVTAPALGVTCAEIEIKPGRTTVYKPKL